jgi:HlyD family secretion protein
VDAGGPGRLGWLTRVHTFGLGHRGAKESVIVVNTDTESVPVHLGPTAFLRDRKAAVKKGGRFTVTGSRATLRGSNIVLAREARKGDGVWALRNAAGQPFWSTSDQRRAGSGRQRKSFSSQSPRRLRSWPLCCVTESCPVAVGRTMTMRPRLRTFALTARAQAVAVRHFAEIFEQRSAPTLDVGVEERLRKIALAVIALAALGVAAFLWNREASSQSQGGNAAAQVVPVVRRDIRNVVKATGIIKPRVGAEVRVGSRISGVVKRLYVQIGDRVQKGQLLAELDDRDLTARRDEAVAALQQADVNVSYAKTDLERKRRLSTEGILARSDLDLAERAEAVADRQVTAARATLDYAATQLAYTRIVAPIAGVVASVATQEGETVAADFAAPTFVTLIDLSRLEVWAYVDETDIGRIQPRQKATFTVDTYGDHEFGGRVAAVYPKAEIRDNVVNYVTVVQFDPPRDRTLRPEMTTTVRIALEARDDVLALPIRAVRGAGADTYVLTRRGGSIERRRVTTGRRDDSYWEIVDGVREGDEVLVGTVHEEDVIDDRTARNQ